MATTQSYLKAFLSAAQAQEILNAGAAFIGIYVSIDTDDQGSSQYGISVKGTDSNKDAFSAVPIDVCPTPCPTHPGQP